MKGVILAEALVQSIKIIKSQLNLKTEKQCGAEKMLKKFAV